MGHFAGADGGPWADQNGIGSIVSTTLIKTGAGSAIAYTNVEYLSFAVEQRYSFVAPNILKISEIIHNGQYANIVWFQRNWNVDLAPTLLAENSFGPVGTAPHVLDTTTYGFEHPDASIPYAHGCLGSCNETGNLGGGIKVEFKGFVPAYGSARVDYYYGISQPGQSSSNLITQALGTGARLLMVTQSTKNGSLPNAGGSSAFIGVDTVVPEPASWAMMIVGFGLTGATMRRRRLMATRQGQDLLNPWPATRRGGSARVNERSGAPLWVRPSEMSVVPSPVDARLGCLGKADHGFNRPWP